MYQVSELVSSTWQPVQHTNGFPTLHHFHAMVTFNQSTALPITNSKAQMNVNAGMPCARKKESKIAKVIENKVKSREGEA